MTEHEIPRITVEQREHVGSRYAARLRTAGRLPAVIYGHKQDPVHVSADAKEVSDLLHIKAHVFEVVLGDKTESCLVKDVQWDHLGTDIIHLDLARVNLSETVTVEVELDFVGEAAGLKAPGTVLDHPYATVEVKCRVSDIPELIRIDVSSLEVNDTLTVADLELPADVTCTMDAATVVAAVRLLSIAEEEEEEEAVEEGAVEPEVIGRDKTDEPEAGEEEQDSGPSK